MRGLDDYYGDDSDAFAGVEELNDRIAELEAENKALRGDRERIRSERDAAYTRLSQLSQEVLEGRA